MEAIPLSTLYVTLVVLLVVSGFFSISETSMMAINRYRLKHLVQSGHRGARLASDLLAKTDTFLGVVLLGNNLINAASALLVGLIAERYLGQSELSLFVATAVAGSVILVFSEITPKIVGATYPERIALPAAYVLTPLLRITQPVVWFINLFVQTLLGLMRLRRAPGHGEQKLSVEELRTLVLETSYLPQKHQSILLNLFDLEAITVDDVMVPRNHIEAFDFDAPLDTLRQQIATSHHRRVLLYRGHLDEVLGTLRVRSVLNLVQNEELSKDKLRELMREPYYVPAGTPLFSQLQNFQEQQDRLSLVVDEYGELMGLVTLEDILEELIGEFTTQSPLLSGGFVKQPDGSYLVEGATLLRELNRKLGFSFPLDGPKTLNGLILEHLQSMPEPSTSVKISGHPLEIVQTQDRVVKAVRVIPPVAA
ncbi:MAG TPA: HlyC/CorC family transporter [Burkholderiales bacterium]